MILKEYLNAIHKAYTPGHLYHFTEAYAAYGISLMTKRPVVGKYPPILMLEPTNICNLKCPMCPSGNGTLKRPKGYMDFDLYKKIVDESAQKTSMICFWNQGEPFLHPRILDMFRYCSERKIYSMTSTNANIMPDAEDIVRSGLDSMIVSLDGASQDTYNRYRVNGDFEKVIENARKIIEAKKRLKSRTPSIIWQFIVMKHNENEIEQIKNLSKRLGVDQMVLKTVQLYTKEDMLNFMPSNPRYRRYKIDGEHFELKHEVKNRCYRIWTNPVINWDGEMAVCCFDKDVDHPVGNVKDQSIEEIWRGQRFNRMRQIILKNRKAIPMCLNCGEGIKLKISQKNIHSDKS